MTMRVEGWGVTGLTEEYDMPFLQIIPELDVSNICVTTYRFGSTLVMGWYIPCEIAGELKLFECRIVSTGTLQAYIYDRYKQSDLGMPIPNEITVDQFILYVLAYGIRKPVKE